MYYISDYSDGNKFVGIYLCKSKQILKAKTGKSYCSLILQDKTGTIDGKIWDMTMGINEFEPMQYIYCEGMVQSYKNSPQVSITRVRVADEGEYDERDYIPVTDKNIDELYAQLLGFVDSVKKPYFSKLLNKYFREDKEFVKNFKGHSAAKSVHHGYMGGLLEHTVAVTKMCDYFAANYPIIKRDLLITAAIFHDMGKIYELSDFPRNDYTDEGQLLGHIFIGAAQLTNAINEIEGFPKKAGDELVHCILAHHGQMEYGSPKVPALIEAWALHLADNADAKLQTMKETLNKAGNSKEWLGFNKLLNSNIRWTSDEA